MKNLTTLRLALSLLGLSMALARLQRTRKFSPHRKTLGRYLATIKQLG